MIAADVSLRSTLERLGAVSTKYDDQDKTLAKCLSVVIHETTRARADTLLQKWPANPALCMCSADATSFLTRSEVTETAVSGEALRRRGRTLEEFYCQILMIKVMSPTGVIELAVIKAPVRPLQDGKRAPNLVQAALDCWTTIEVVGSERITINTRCFDRAVLSSIARLLDGMLLSFLSPARGHEDSELARLRSWFRSVGCALHDGQGGIRWMCAPWVSKDAQKNLYLAIESLRKTFLFMHAHLRQFLLKATVFQHVFNGMK
jgi:hypothetical protein